MLSRRNFIGLLAGALAASVAPSILIPRDGQKSIVPARPRLRKLRAVWTFEADQDLQAFHGIEADEAFTGAMGDEFVKTGVVYAPYMPRYQSGIEGQELEGLRVSKKFLSAFARKMVNPEMFASVSLL